MRKMPFLRITIYSIIGIYLAGSFEINLYFPVFLLILVGISQLVTKFISRFRSHNFTGILTLLFFLCLGAFAQKVHQLPFNVNHFSQFTTEQSKLLIKIKSVKQGYFSKYVGNVELVCHQDSCRKVSGLILIKSENDSFDKGDQVFLSSAVHIFLPQKNRFAFDEKRFYGNKAIFHHTFSNEIALVKANQSFLNRYRKVVQGKIQGLAVSDEVKGVIAAMILGDKSDLGEVEAIFRKTGTSHVLAISGLHVGIIAAIIFYLLSFMPPSMEKLKYLIVVILIWLFCLLSGAMPSTVRSCIMLSCFLFGKSIGRSGLSYNYCFAAAFFMLLKQPGLIYDVGFQFSFSAIIGILYFYEPIYKALQCKGAWNYCWQLISMSMAAQLMITPLSLYYFHEFPLLFLLTSLIAIPSTFVVIALSLISIVLSNELFDFLMLDYLLNWFVEAFLSLLHIFASNEDLVLTNLFPEKFEIGVYYVLVFSITVFFHQQLQKYLYLFIVSFLLLVSYQFKVNHELSKTCVVVYAHEEAVMIDVMNSGAVTHFYELGSRPTQADWIAKNLRTKYKISKQENIGIPSNSNYALTIGPLTIGIMNIPEIDQSICNSDLLLINTKIPHGMMLDYQNEIIDFGNNAMVNAKQQQQLIKILN